METDREKKVHLLVSPHRYLRPTLVIFSKPASSLHEPA